MILQGIKWSCIEAILIYFYPLFIVIFYEAGEDKKASKRYFLSLADEDFVYEEGDREMMLRKL